MQQKKLDNYLYSLMPQKMQGGGRPKKPAKRVFFAIAPEQISEVTNLVDDKGRVLDEYDESLQGKSFKSLRREISNTLKKAGDSIFSRPEFNDFSSRFKKEYDAKEAFIKYLSNDIAGVISDNADITFGNLDENSPRNDEERASYTGRLQTPIQDVLNQVKNEYGVDVSGIKDLDKLYSGMSGYKYLQENTYNPTYKINTKQTKKIDPTFIFESKQASKISMATEGVPSEVIVLSSEKDFREKLPEILKQNKGQNAEFGIFTHAGNFLRVPQEEVNSLISENIDEGCKLGLYSCYGLSQVKDTFKDVKNITHNIGGPWTGVPRFRTQAEYDALKGRSFADVMYSINPEGKYFTAKPGRDYIDTSLIKEGEREKIYEDLRIRRAEEMALRDLRRAARSAGTNPPTRLPQDFDLSSYLNPNSSVPTFEQWASERGNEINDDTRRLYGQYVMASGYIPTFDQWLYYIGPDLQNASSEELQNFYEEDVNSMRRASIENSMQTELRPIQEPLPQLQPRMPSLRSTRGGARNGGLQKLQGGGFPNINIPNLSIGSIFGAYGQAGTQYGNLFNFPAGDNPFKPKTVNTKSWLDLSGVEQQTKKVEIAKELNLTASGGSWKDASGQTYENDQLLKMAEEKYNSERTNTEEYNKMLPFGQLAYGSMNLQDMVSQELKNKKEKIQDFPVMKSTYAPKGFAEQGGAVNYLQQLMGYKDNSPYKNLPYQDIYSDRITMKGVSQPLLATTDNGISTVMQPGGEYYFPGASVVREKRMDAPPVPTPDEDFSGRRILRKMQDGGKIKTFSNDPEWFNSQTFDNWTIKQLRTGKYGVDPESGALYKLKKPVKVPQEFLDLTSENPSDTETARRGAAFSGLQTAYQNPAMQAPGIIGLGGAMAPTALRVLNTPIALGRFTNAALTPQKVLSAVGAGLAPFNAAEGVKNIQEGNYAEGAADLALAGLDLYVPELLGPAGAINKALKSSMRTLPNIEELRRIFHNQERILSEDELIKLTQEGRGIARDYIDPSYRVDLSNPEQANIWDTNLDGLRRIRTQQLFSTPSANLGPKAGDAVKNKSELTKKDVLGYVNLKDKDKVSKMTDSEFSNTVLKPNGEIVPYSKDIPEKLSKNITPISNDEFITEFNQNIDRLNEIINRRNSTGIQYKVKELTPDGKLIFETPPQPTSSSTLGGDQEALRIFESDPIAFLVERGGLRQNDAGNWVLDNLDPLVEFQNLEDVVSTARSEINNAITPSQIEGTSYWDVYINPGRFTGDVEDIASTEYLRDTLPGLNMIGTGRSVFPDRVARKGSGAYESINEYLKELGLGRVKSGFNSQTNSSLSAWQNFVNSGRGVGFYGGPFVIHGALKNWIPGGIALGALMGTQENQEDGEVQNKKQGGMILSKKRKTPPVPTPDNMFIMKNGGTMYANNLPNAKIGKKIGNFFSDLGRGWLDTLGNVTGGWDLDDSKYKTNIAKNVASVTNPISKISGSLTRSIGEAVLPGSGSAAGQMWKSVGSSMPSSQTPTYTPTPQTQQNPLANLNSLLGAMGPALMTGSMPNLNSFMSMPQGMFQQGGELDMQQMGQPENPLIELPMEQQVELYKGLIDFVVENGIEELASQHPQEYEFFEMFNDYLDDLDEEEEEEVQEEEPMSPEEMANGGIPQRYKNLGFSKVGQKRQSTRPGKKWMVLAKKGDQYKVVHGGAKGMSDFTKHKNEKRRNRFWDRMGGKSSAKATDPFSPLYWHKRFKTW
jgi:hypothetical protein